MTHATVSVGGPLWFVLVGMILASIGLAIYVLVDSWRPVRVETAKRLGRKLVYYRVGQTAFLVLLFGSQIPAAPALARGIAVLLMPVSIVQALVYLLRVVFPAPPSDRAAHQAAGQADEADEAEEAETH